MAHAQDLLRPADAQVREPDEVSGSAFHPIARLPVGTETGPGNSFASIRAIRGQSLFNSQGGFARESRESTRMG